MHSAKKYASLLLMIVLCVSCTLWSAAAETDLSGYSITDATVAAVSHKDITAPFSGTLCAFDWESGDTVEEGCLLFSYLTTDLYAPADGTVTELFTAVGEPASYALQNYGSLGSIAPEISQRMNCTTAGAHKDVEGEVYVGQTLYFKSTKGDKDEGHGRVISRTGNSFVLEILEGNFEVGEKLALYQTSSRKDKEDVGDGIVAHADPFSLSGSGVVCAIYAEVGQKVTKGEKILSLVSADADPGASAEVLSPCGGVLQTLAVTSGQQVWKGELLCRILLTDSLEIVAQVDEMDLHDLRVGDRVYVTLDTDKTDVLTGDVTEISALGVTKANAAYYTVHVSLNGNASMRIGQSASLYLPKE